LREISKRRPLALHIITDPDRPRSISFLPKIESSEITRAIFNDVILHRWDASTFSDIVTKCDAAIIPIFVNDPLFGGKPGNKLALLWRMAMPVVTSATPAYRRMQEAAGLGYLACDNNADWFAALDRLMADETARRESGERGYAFVSANLQSTRSLALWDDVFASIGFDFRER
jgi:glycosyltransferase involved in cell wall biosynthesis